ncbi:MAG: efflux RND transporter periplasmic adaptor subunit [Aquificaceae bacterium]|jgi:Cu(I)/Ag(I) efflux system membrane fusion protein|uniref:efflux RND transporter periplasmic adaptor subunit n=1 Tax=Hydrogenobacter sp. Uz 6-8 TaxID=3384828 RepID=UPI0030A5E722
MKRWLFLGISVLIASLTAFFLYLSWKSKKAEDIAPKGYLLTLSLEGEGVVLKLYTRDGSLRVGKNTVFVEIKPEKRLQSLYFYMPPMPGMGEMREDAGLKELKSGRYEGTVDISMAGSWQVIAQVEGKILKRDISIPFTPGQGEQKREEGISVSPEKLQLLGVQTEEVKRVELLQSFSTVGYVSYDLSRTYEITVRSDGWVLDTFGRFEGELINKGTPLMRIMSPEGEIAQAELRLARDMGRKELEKLVLERLSYLKAGDVVTSPYSGVVLERRVSPGGFLKAGDVAYRIADISRVWVIAEVPQEYAGSVKRGMKVLVSPVGGESVSGRVDYIFPEANRDARTVRVRIDLPGKGLKINQLVEVYFERPLGEALAVPESAVVDTGKRQIVFVEKEPGLYEPRRVRVGRRAEGYYEVLEGLREGERVVVRGTFLLDSEAQLRGVYGQEVKGHEHHH